MYVYMCVYVCMCVCVYVSMCIHTYASTAGYHCMTGDTWEACTLFYILLRRLAKRGHPNTP